jgi:glyoxylase-like metal-dependent hydrolase (beta-lactamase superfamily II)/8-oxo-dGTP pyrophosphatase MutT (NUDIX family)
MSEVLFTGWQPAPGAVIRPAATLVVLREQGALQTLLLRRSAHGGDLLAGSCVFPGGTLTAADRAAHAHCAGLDDAAASRRLALPAGGLDFHVAAVRECFEEAGLLFATAPDGSPPTTAQLGQLAALRTALHRGVLDLGQICTQLGLRLAPAALRYFSHWLTPPGVPKRYDARFFVALAPGAQAASPDNAETVELLWLTPGEALERRTELKLTQPTTRTLQWLATHRTAESVLHAVEALTEIRCIMPRLGTGPGGLVPVLPEHPAWAELGKLDPEGYGRCRYDLLPGRAVQLSPHLLRVTAPNGNMMTGPGTNSYFIGGGPRNEWALLDPGPADDAHVRALLAALPGRLRWIFVTHTHPDHSPAAVALRSATGAAVHGMPPAHAEWQDATFHPDGALRGGEIFHLPGNRTLQAIHTPGHAGNHLCYHLHEERLLFTGDHVMQHATVVINPPDGDMTAYLASLRELETLDVDWLAPGHGFLMARPRAAIRAIIEHRLRREARVLAALRPESAEVDGLLATVYADVRPELLGVARRSLLAHLIKLHAEGRALEEQGRWKLATTSGNPP